MEPDFEALRAARNAKWDETFAKLRADGWDVVPCALREKNACYYGCANGGPCEHKWDGEWWESEDGCGWSATCSRCGMTAMSHNLHCGA